MTAAPGTDGATAKTVPVEIVSWFDRSRVLFRAEVDATIPLIGRIRAALQIAVKSRADLSGAYLSGADLSGANLSRADLSGANLSEEQLRAFRADLWLTLSEIGGPLEVQHLIAKLKAGEVDGSTYDGDNECACLVGTIAQQRGVAGDSLDHNSDRPAERWFMMINPGDKPGDETGGGFAAGKALEWAQGWAKAHGIPTEPDPQDEAA